MIVLFVTILLLIFTIPAMAFFTQMEFEALFEVLGTMGKKVFMWNPSRLVMYSTPSDEGKALAYNKLPPVAGIDLMREWSLRSWYVHCPLLSDGKPEYQSDLNYDGARYYGHFFYNTPISEIYAEFPHQMTAEALEVVRGQNGLIDPLVPKITITDFGEPVPRGDIPNLENIALYIPESNLDEFGCLNIIQKYYTCQTIQIEKFNSCEWYTVPDTMDWVGFVNNDLKPFLSNNPVFAYYEADTGRAFPETKGRIIKGPATIYVPERFYGIPYGAEYEHLAAINESNIDPDSLPYGISPLDEVQQSEHFFDFTFEMAIPSVTTGAQVTTSVGIVFDVPYVDAESNINFYSFEYERATSGLSEELDNILPNIYVFERTKAGDYSHNNLLSLGGAVVGFPNEVYDPTRLWAEAFDIEPYSTNAEIGANFYSDGFQNWVTALSIMKGSNLEGLGEIAASYNNIHLSPNIEDTIGSQGSLREIAAEDYPMHSIVEFTARHATSTSVSSENWGDFETSGYQIADAHSEASQLSEEPTANMLTTYFAGVEPGMNDFQVLGSTITAGAYSAEIPLTSTSFIRPPWSTDTGGLKTWDFHDFFIFHCMPQECPDDYLLTGGEVDEHYQDEAEALIGNGDGPAVPGGGPDYYDQFGESGADSGRSGGETDTTPGGEF